MCVWNANQFRRYEKKKKILVGDTHTQTAAIALQNGSPLTAVMDGAKVSPTHPPSGRTNEHVFCVWAEVGRRPGREEEAQASQVIIYVHRRCPWKEKRKKKFLKKK